MHALIIRLDVGLLFVACGLVFSLNATDSSKLGEYALFYWCFSHYIVHRCYPVLDKG
jgi:hypothetical protein